MQIVEPTRDGARSLEASRVRSRGLAVTLVILCNLDPKLNL
jgi:hypothetical protein